MIFVVGAARSGTSLTARIIEQCGARLGAVNGLAEIRSLKDEWVYPELKKRGFDRFGQDPIPLKPIRDIKPADARKGIGSHIEGVDCVKDVKLIHFWPIVAQAFPDAKWLIVWRDPVKIAQSCMRTGFMHRLKTEDEWVEWALTYHQRCEELREKYPDRVYETSINAMKTAEGQEGISAAVESIGLEWDPGAITRVFNPSKWTG